MIEPVSPAEFIAAVDALTDTYRETFSGPPWDESGEQVQLFAGGVASWAVRDGFRAAWVRDGETVIGFAFRVRTPQPVPDAGFYAVLRNRFGAHVESLAGAVEVVELAVRPSARGRGLGRDLLGAVAGAKRAWLVTRTDAEGTLAFYRRLGWRQTVASAGLVLLEQEQLEQEQDDGK